MGFSDGRSVDRQRIRCAQLEGAAAGIRDELRRGEAALEERQRREWPALWERIDRLVDLVDG